MAKSLFLMQGLTETESHKNNLKKVLSIEECEKIILSTAFLNSDGVHLIKDELKMNQDKIEVYAGCRNGITTKQGIASLLELGIKVYVVDTGSRSFIFHPKAFLGQGKKRALSIVGSANMTYGGLVNNLEASSILELDLMDSSDAIYVNQFIKVFETLRADYPENVVLVESLERVQELFEQGKLVDEEEVKETVNVGANKQGQGISPTMKLKREKVILPSKKRKKKIKEQCVASEGNENNEQEMQSEVIMLDVPVNMLEVWRSKELKERDLNVPSGTGTNPTGSMLLKKGIYPVDQQTYFRHQVFKDLKWEKKDSKKPYEYTNVGIYFVIEGINYGKYELTLKHDPRIDTVTYKQKQPMTSLSWGAAKKIVANRELLGKEMVLYKVKGNKNEFVIEIRDIEE